MNMKAFNIEDSGNPYIQIDDRLFDSCIADAMQHFISDEVGFFGPDSMSWKVFREPVVLLGGYRAIMLQMAHPAVAQGVEHSSSFRNDVIGRAKRTISAMNSLIFGTKKTALGAAYAMHNVHNNVYGVVPNHIESHWAGKSFRANDPDLINWVGLTTLQTVVVMFERFVRKLEPAEKCQLAKEMQSVALLCGLPKRYHHENLESQDLALENFLQGGELAVDKIAKGIVQVLFDFTPGSIDARLTYGLLPERARELYGIKWTAEDQKSHDSLASRISFLNRSFPKSIRYIPAYHQAVARVEKENSKNSGNSGQGPRMIRRRQQSSQFYMRLFGMGN